ncbi:MAG: hypothetical protein HC895_18795 [Leptolyngbyaceae cyanobacterium SM1_3_5]|nr:hypothetical protein [Leptolyngbyaceae cyanobacterium SM1_3_5]
MLSTARSSCDDSNAPLDHPFTLERLTAPVQNYAANSRSAVVHWRELPFTDAPTKSAA